MCGEGDIGIVFVCMCGGGCHFGGGLRGRESCIVRGDRDGGQGHMHVWEGGARVCNGGQESMCT